MRTHMDCLEAGMKFASNGALLQLHPFVSHFTYISLCAYASDQMHFS